MLSPAKRLALLASRRAPRAEGKAWVAQRAAERFREGSLDSGFAVAKDRFLILINAMVNSIRHREIYTNNSEERRAPSAATRTPAIQSGAKRLAMLGHGETHLANF